MELHTSPKLSIVRLVYLALILGLFDLTWLTPGSAQLSENTNNESRGSTNTFTITINSQHGVQTNASRTPDFKVETFGSMIVGPDSTSIQTNNDGASGFMSTSGGVGE